MNDLPDPLDVLVILIEPVAPARARYQGLLRAAALTIAESLSQQGVVRRQLRHVALLDAARTPGGLLLSTATQRH